MTNAYYNHSSGVPALLTRGVSSLLRSEFDLIQSGFARTETAMLLRASIASPAFTGIPTAPTAAPGTSSTQLATTAFVAEQAFSAVLPAQPGNAGKFLKTDGTSASWDAPGLIRVLVTATTQAATAGNHYVLTNVAATTVTLPAGVEGATVAITATGALITNVVAPNGAETIMEVAASMTLDKAGVTITLRYLNNSWRLI